MNRINRLPSGKAQLIAVIMILGAPWPGAGGQTPPDRPADAASSKPTIESSRLAMSKWIETQQIISKEKKDWQQQKEILVGRRELVGQEVAGLEEKIRQAGQSVAQAEKRRQELLAEKEGLNAIATRLAARLAELEADVHRIVKQLPDHVKAKVLPLSQRIPQDPAATRVSVAERFQNVIGILNEVNKTNGEITVNYEVHELSGGRPSEVRALYVGLAQAYFVSPGGEAGIGRPTADGWKWESSKAISGDVLTALEILQGKHSPVYVPLPVKIQ